MSSSILGLVLSLTTALQGTGGCPPADAQSLAQDPTVAAAFDEAWTNSMEGTRTEHEEGGWIYRCQGVNIDNPAEWVTVVDHWKSGWVDGVDRTPLSSNPDCELVGEFHTHPGPPRGHPENDGFSNDVPSDNDVATAQTFGVPAFIIYGTGSDPAGTTIRSYGPPEPTKPCTPNPDPGSGTNGGPGGGPGSGSPDGGSPDSGSGDGGPDSGPGDGGPDGGSPGSGSGTGDDGGAFAGTGASSGDPHLVSFDGTHLDFQASGEFVVVRSADDTFEIQARQETPFATSHLTVNTAIAVRLDGSIVEVAEERLIVDGEELEVLDAVDGLPVPGGGMIEGGPGSWVFTWADGTRAHFLGRSVVVQLGDTHQGTVEGLLGNYDGDPGNDFVDAEGNSLGADGALTFDDTYGLLAPAWQVTEDSSLFTYDDGESPDTFARDDVPGFGLFVDLLPDDVREEAEATCRDAGVDDPQRLQDCALDVGATGDPSFADEAAGVEDIVEGGTADGGGSPPLARAAELGDDDEVDRLLAAGEDVEGEDDEGRTALIWATFAGQEDIVAALLAAGADPDHQDSSGETALHVAATFDLRGIAELLVDADVDPGIENENGQTAREIAEVQGNTEIMEMLS